ncbi:MAG: hypothetical protein ACYDHW_03730 [Syntrophorhabdaceae bacterium]
MKRAFWLSVVVLFAAVLFFPGVSIVNAQRPQGAIESGSVPDQPDNPWSIKAKAADIMISEAQKTIQRCNEQIARAEELKKMAQEGRTRTQVAGGTRTVTPGGGQADQPNYPWLSMEQAADQIIADARRTIESCELQIKHGQQMKIEAIQEMKRWGY